MPKGPTLEMEQRQEQKGLTVEPPVLQEQDPQADQLRGELRDTISRLQRYLAEKRAGMNAEQIADAEQRIKNVEDKLFELR